MRHNQTDAEAKLWSRLRNNQLNGYKFRRQVPVAGYILDFFCLAEKFAVELDGSQHGEEAAIQYDDRRTHRLQLRDIRVLRFSNFDALKFTDTVLATILRELQQNPHPNPLPEYRARE